MPPCAEGGAHRWLSAAASRPPLIRFAVAYLAGVVAEWALFVVAIVDAFDRGGASGAGVASIALLVAGMVTAPFAAVATDRFRPARVRLGAYALQTIGFGAAAWSAAIDAPVGVVIAWAALGAGAITFVRPACAVLVPAIVRSSRELTTANLVVGACESVAVLAGPLFAALLLALGATTAGFAGVAAAAGLAFLVAVVDRRTDPPSAGADEGEARGPWRTMRRCLSALRRRPGSTGLLVATGTQSVLVGAFDFLYVVLAIDVLDRDESWAGWLATAFGAGAVLSAIVAALWLRTRRLAPLVAAMLAVIAAGCGVFAGFPVLVVALIALPILGFSRSLLDLASRMLLQRSVPPTELAGVFALVELQIGAGLLAGSIIAQILVAVGGAQAALTGLTAVFVVVLLLTRGPLRALDAATEVPVVAVSLLRRHPVFSPLPPLALEAVALAAEERVVPAGTVVIAEGDPGDEFFVVADGVFDVSAGGEHLRRVGRGDGFGEVALLVDIPRTATVRAVSDADVLVIPRTPFLIAVTGSDSSRSAAWGAMRSLAYPEPLSALQPHADRDGDGDGDGQDGGITPPGGPRSPAA